MNKEAIAKICHQANKAFCETLGDETHLDWEKAPLWQRETMIKGVEFRLKHPDAPVSAQHEEWMKEKLKENWKRGDVKDVEKRTHPCLVPFNELPEHLKRKDELFTSIVRACTVNPAA